VRERTGIFYDRNINASPLEFRRQMEYIKKKFNLISMSELVECYEQKRNLKPNSLMVTFDDGYRDVAFNAFPILKELGIPAVAFLITGVIDTDAISWEDQISFIFQTIPNGTVKITEDAVYSLKSPGEKDISLWQVCKKLKEIRSIERNRIINELIETYQIDVEQMGKLACSMNMGYMRSEEIQYWNNYGIEFGVHTITHDCLTELDFEDINHEIVGSKRRIESILNKPIKAFAYPFGKDGDYNALTKSGLIKAGFKIGVIFESGINKPGTDPLELYRIGVEDNHRFRLDCHGITSLSPKELVILLKK
ncbi:MAG: hypothetical protein FJW61_06230, partial [Actinobacteria bacterium]|nr:hypothetical protein [Actinomycetota bacterium]